MALFPVAVWLPWLLVGAAGVAVLGLRVLGGQLPAGALHPGPHAAAVDETRQAILGRLAAKRKN